MPPPLCGLNLPDMGRPGEPYFDFLLGCLLNQMPSCSYKPLAWTTCVQRGLLRPSELGFVYWGWGCGWYASIMSFEALVAWPAAPPSSW